MNNFIKNICFSMRKLLLFSITISLLTNSCSINTSFLSWLFGDSSNILKAKNVKKLACNRAGKDFTGKPKFKIKRKRRLNSDDNFGLGLAFFGIAGLLATTLVILIQESIKEKNKLDKGKSDGSGKEDGSKAEMKVGSKPETKPEKKSETKPEVKVCKRGEKAPLIRERFEEVIDFAKGRNALIGQAQYEIDVPNFIESVNKEGAKIELIQDGTKQAINRIYQIRVAGQDDASCGPRALYNSQILDEVFWFKKYTNVIDSIFGGVNIFGNSNQVELVNGVDKLTDLFEFEGKENPRLSVFFATMREATKNGKKIFEDKELNKKNSAPQMADCAQLDDFNKYCAFGNRRPFEIKNVYVVSFANPKFTDNTPLFEREVGFTRSYTVLLQNGDLAKWDDAKKGGHYVSVFVAKTGENEYSWIITDSSNGNLVQDLRIRESILKLFW